MIINFRLTFLLSVITFFLSQRIFGQSIDTEQFDQLIRTEFTKIVSPNNSSNLGSYASLDTKESEISFAGAIAPKLSKRPFLIGLKFEGGASDGILSIFDDEQFATKVGGEIQFSILTNRHKEYIIYNVDLEDKQIKELAKNEKEYQQRLIEIQFCKDSLDLINATVTKEKEIFQLENGIKDAYRNIDSLIARIDRASDSRKKDSMQFKLRELELAVPLNEIEIKKKRDQRKQLKDDLKKLEPAWEQRFDALNSKLSADMKAKEKFEITGFKVQWFSIIAGFSNKTFRLFDSTAIDVSVPLKDQFDKSDFLAPNLGLSYSWFKKDKRIEFWNLAAMYRNNDNSSSLTELTLKDRVSYPTNNTSRTSESELNVLDNTSMTYEEDLLNVEFSLDYYRFMFQNNGAVHLNINHYVNDKKKPFTDVVAGIFYSFKKLGDDKKGSLINAELFFTFEDIFDIRDKEDNIFERTGIGLRTTFPIVFN